MKRVSLSEKAQCLDETTRKSVARHPEDYVACIRCGQFWHKKAIAETYGLMTKPMLTIVSQKCPDCSGSLDYIPQHVVDELRQKWY